MRGSTLAEIEIGLLVEEAAILQGSFETAEDHVKAEALTGPLRVDKFEGVPRGLSGVSGRFTSSPQRRSAVPGLLLGDHCMVALCAVP